MANLPASVLLEDAYRMIGWDPAQLETRQKQMARQSLSLALQEVFESWWWEELMISAQVPVAPVYSATVAYVYGNFVYFHTTQKFYQCLVAATGQPPAILNTDGSGSYLPNYAYWAEAADRFTVGDFSATTVTTLGLQVRSLLDGNTYQCVATNTLSLTINGGDQNGNTVIPAGTGIGGRPYYNSTTNWVQIYWSGTVWIIGSQSHGIPGPQFQSASNTATPDLATNWTVTGGTVAPTSVSITALDPSVSANWVALIPFTPEIDNIGEIRAVSTYDPRTYVNAQAIDFERTGSGYRLPGWITGQPWVWYRIPTPILTGDDYDPTLSYSQDNVSTDGQGKVIRLPSTGGSTALISTSTNAWSGTVSLLSGANSGSVTFTNALPSAPLSITLTVTGPSGGQSLFATVISGSETTSGFSFSLSSPTPDGTYSLNYSCAY